MRRLLFRVITAIHIFLYRLTGGRLGSAMRGYKILLLTTKGRKTGRARTTPLGYFEHEGDYVIIGSFGGSDSHPAWFHNLRVNPEVVIQAKNRHIKAMAEQADPEARERLWARLVQLAPGYEEYQKRTTRRIPLVILRPVDHN